MAKKKIETILPSLFAKPETGSSEKEDKYRSREIVLRESEWRRLEAIGKESGMTAQALVTNAVRDFLKRHESEENRG